MAPRSGVEGAEQAVPGDNVAQTLEAAHRAFLFDQKGRVDLAGGVIHGHDLIEVAVETRGPAMRRAVLVQQHARQRPPRRLLAMDTRARRHRQQLALIQERLGPAVAPGEVCSATRCSWKCLAEKFR